MRTKVRRRWENDYVRTALVVLLGLLYLCIFILPRLPSSMRGRDERRFIYSRVPQSMVMLLVEKSEYPDWVGKVFRFDENSIREDAITVFESGMSRDRIPSESLLDWATLFLRLGENQRVQTCLQELAEGKGDAAMRRVLVQAMTEGKEPEPDVVDWAYQNYRAGQSELPEWYFLATVRGDRDPVDWLEEKGSQIVRRGVFASSLGVVAFLVSVVAGIWFLVIRKRLNGLPGGRILYRSWRWKVLVRDFFIAEMLGLALTGIVSLFIFGGPYDLAVLAMGLVFITVPCFWLVWRLTPSPCAALRAFGIIRPNWPKKGIILLGLVGVLWLAVEVFFLRVFDSAGLGVEDAIRPEFLDRKFALFNGLFLASVIAPIFEETMFRGFLFGGLRPKLGAVPSALLTSLLFALLHGYSWVGLVATFGYGLVFCWMYARSGSLLPGILTHAVFNFVVMTQVAAWYSLD